MLTRLFPHRVEYVHFSLPSAKSSSDKTIEYFYPYIFSFDKILNGIETSQAIVSSLIGIDCTDQATNQMKGMMYNGATIDEVVMVREVVVMIAQELNVHFKAEPVAVPQLE